MRLPVFCLLRDVCSVLLIGFACRTTAQEQPKHGWSGQPHTKFGLNGLRKEGFQMGGRVLTACRCTGSPGGKVFDKWEGYSQHAATGCALTRGSLSRTKGTHRLAQHCVHPNICCRKALQTGKGSHRGPGHRWVKADTVDPGKGTQVVPLGCCCCCCCCC